MNTDTYTIKHKMITVSLLILFCCFLLPVGILNAGTNEDDVEKRARKYYMPETWPKLSLPLVQGLKIEEIRLEGFKLKEKRYFSTAKGTNYIWHNEKEKFELRIIVNVCRSVETAHQELYQWLVTGTSALLKKSTLSKSDAQIGDISWADSNFNILAFARRNVVVILFGYTNKAGHRQVIDKVAQDIDRVIHKAPQMKLVAPRDILMIAPVIDRITLSKSKLKLNERAKINVQARDPEGGKLEYGYHATGGNILRTKEGIFYQAMAAGTHTITVFVVNPRNVISEKTISVEVTNSNKKEKGR